MLKCKLDRGSNEISSRSLLAETHPFIVFGDTIHVSLLKYRFAYYDTMRYGSHILEILILDINVRFLVALVNLNNR